MKRTVKNSTAFVYNLSVEVVVVLYNQILFLYTSKVHV